MYVLYVSLANLEYVISWQVV